MKGKYRYTKVSRNFVTFFGLLQFAIIFINIWGILRFQTISVPDFLIISVVLFGQLITNFYIFFGFKQFDRKEHTKVFDNYQLIKKKDLPTVDIFLPNAGETIEVITRTCKAVSKIDYPKSKLKVIVLDDKGRDEVKALAKSFKFTYLSRPNKGVFKKAGNLKHGYENSKGDFILVLDADFAPRPEILNELLAYHLADPKIGIVQSPQDFEIDPSGHPYIQKGDIAIQEYFYKIIESARSTYNATICVGTNAIYRRKALKDAGGFYQIEHSEDSHTGMSIVKAGYKIHYVPLVLAKGYCPSNYNILFKQRTRWCQGSLSLALTEMFHDADLSPMARLSYFSGFWYYLNSFILLLIPFHSLYLLYTPQKALIVDTLFFLPNILQILITLPIYYYPRFSFSVLGNQFFFNWAYAYVIIKKFILRQNEEWVATGSVVKKNSSYTGLVTLTLIYISLYWLLTIFVVSRIWNSFNITDGILLFWIGYNILSHISYLIGLFISSEIKLPKIQFKLTSDIEQAA